MLTLLFYDLGGSDIAAAVFTAESTTTVAKVTRIQTVAKVTRIQTVK